MNHPTAADARVAKAVQMGDRNWVAQQSAIESLPTAARGAAPGETHQPAAELTQGPASLSERNRSPIPQAEAIALLTARELDVLRCLIEGLTRTQIGLLLHISPNTVRTHIQSILHKLDVHSALTAVAFARRAEIVDLPEGEVNPANDGHRSIQRGVSPVMSS